MQPAGPLAGDVLPVGFLSSSRYPKNSGCGIGPEGRGGSGAPHLRPLPAILRAPRMCSACGPAATRFRSLPPLLSPPYNPTSCGVGAIRPLTGTRPDTGQSRGNGTDGLSRTATKSRPRLAIGRLRRGAPLPPRPMGRDVPRAPAFGGRRGLVRPSGAGCRLAPCGGSPAAVPPFGRRA